MPDVNVSYDISELFKNFAFNFNTILPLVYIVVGVAFAGYLGLKIKDLFVGDD